GDPENPLQALIFDSTYDAYRGVISSIRIVEGSVKAGDKIQMMSTGKTFEVAEVGINTPKPLLVETLSVVDVGYIIASIKNVVDADVSDTITNADRPADKPLQGDKKMNPMVVCGLDPIDKSKYNDEREAVERPQVTDAALQSEAEAPPASAYGFTT